MSYTACSVAERATLQYSSSCIMGTEAQWHPSAKNITSVRKIDSGSKNLKGFGSGKTLRRYFPNLNTPFRSKTGRNTLFNTTLNGAQDMKVAIPSMSHLCTWGITGYRENDK